MRYHFKKVINRICSHRRIQVVLTFSLTSYQRQQLTCYVKKKNDNSCRGTCWRITPIKSSKAKNIDDKYCLNERAIQFMTAYDLFCFFFQNSFKQLYSTRIVNG